MDDGQERPASTQVPAGLKFLERRTPLPSLWSHNSHTLTGNAAGDGISWPFGAHALSQNNANAFTFTGRESDGTGLLYYRARYLSPTLQRFISEDPVSFGGGDINLHAYALNRPANFNDPTGKLIPGSVFVAIASCLCGAAIDISGGDLQRWLSARKDALAFADLFWDALGGCLDMFSGAMVTIL